MQGRLNLLWLLQRNERVCPAGPCQIQGEDESKGQGSHQQENGKRLRRMENRLEKICGRMGELQLADMGTYLQNIDEWMGRRIRMVFWKKWKRVCTRRRNLLKLGISNLNAGILANSRKGYWRIASSPTLKAAFSNGWLEKAGFQFFYSYYRKSVAA